MHKDATQCASWQQFVNLHRLVHGSNEELDRPYIRNMREEDLQRAIINMTALESCEKYDFRSEK